MVESRRVELIVKDHAGPLRMDELIQFLIHIRAAYLVAAGHQGDARDDLERAVETGKIVASVLRKMPAAFLQASLLGAAGSKPSNSEELSFLDISRENPTKFILVGSISAIVTAVVLAGGNIEIGASGIKASTPGLVQSVVNIGKAFGTATEAPNISSDTPPLPAPPVLVDKTQENVAKPLGRRLKVNRSSKS